MLGHCTYFICILHERSFSLPFSFSLSPFCLSVNAVLLRFRCYFSFPFGWDDSKACTYAVICTEAGGGKRILSDRRRHNASKNYFWTRKFACSVLELSMKKATYIKCTLQRRTLCESLSVWVCVCQCMMRVIIEMCGEVQDDDSLQQQENKKCCCCWEKRTTWTTTKTMSKSCNHVVRTQFKDISTPLAHKPLYPSLSGHKYSDINFMESV